MEIPSVPTSHFWDKDAQRVSHHWRIFFNQLINELQRNVSNESYILPPQDSQSVNALNTDALIGGILYESNSKSAKINTAGKFKTITTYEELTSTEVSAIPSGERNGRFIYETDSGDLKFGVNDIFKTVQVV